MGPIQAALHVEPVTVHLVAAAGDRHGHARQQPEAHPPADPPEAPEEGDEYEPKASSFDISV